MSILGNRVLRVEDPRFLTVGGTYVDDVQDPLLEGAAYVTYVRSSLAHGRIVDIDTSSAKQADGVLGVFTASELGLEPAKPLFDSLHQGFVRPWLATDVVRFVGEPVAAVVTETMYQGADAAELVAVDYDPLPVVVDPREALRDEVLVHEHAGTNVAYRVGVEELDPHLFDDCDVVVTREIFNNRIAPAPLEVRGAACAWGPDGRLTFWATTQGAQTVRDDLGDWLGVATDRIRVIAPDVGGGFGAKFSVSPEDALVAQLSRLVGRPLRWFETRSESLIAMSHGRGQRQTVTIGGRRDGTVLAYRLEIVQDAGAYLSWGAWLPTMTGKMAPGPYAIRKAESRAVSVVTNTAPVGAYRGAGRPEATAAIERAIDMFAAEIGVDPAEVRRRNLLSDDVFPYDNGFGVTYDIGAYRNALDAVLQGADYAGLRKEQQARRETGDRMLLGIGLSTYVEITGGGSERARVEVRPDGSAVVHTGTSPHGQGHATSWAMIASDKLGIPYERITVLHGDTDLIPTGGGTGGSRSLQLGGMAVLQASTELLERARQLAAEALEANPADIVFDTGRFAVAGDPSSAVSWGDLTRDGPLAESGQFKAKSTVPFGAHLAVVEVDSETGQVYLRRVVTVDDAGTIINPVVTEGQRHGGIGQGAAQALLEEVVYDSDGNPLTTNLGDYAFITAAELPSFELLTMQTPTPHNPLGAKGIGEAATIGSTPAVQNAVVDALSAYGVRHLDMPTTMEKVWQAIQSR